MDTLTTEGAQALAKLREWIKPGDIIYTIERHRTRFGGRSISPVILHEGECMDVSGFAARAMSLPFDRRHGGIRTSGGAFDIAYELGAHLWPKGDGVYVSYRNGSKLPETDGGYCIRHRSL